MKAFPCISSLCSRVREVSPIQGGSLVGSTGEKVAVYLLNGLGSLPMLQQVSDFPARGELVADAVRVDLLELRRVLCGEHHISWVNDLPDTPRCTRRLWPIDKPRGQLGLARQQRRLFQGVFGRLIFQVG